MCHSPEGWQPAQFDHNLTGFKLEGKHATAQCESCHQNGQYKGTPKDCYSCHRADDAHNGQYGTACETCHTSTNWKNATFDHNLSRFPLTGAHVNVKCESCHQNRVFKGTPTECAACHREPEYHAGMFPGQACSQCHAHHRLATGAIHRPAHTFPMNHGQEGGRVNTCADCHQPTLKTWTCYTCSRPGRSDAQTHQRRHCQLQRLPALPPDRSERGKEVTTTMIKTTPSKDSPIQAYQLSFG